MTPEARGDGGHRGPLTGSLALGLALALACGGEPPILPVDGCPAGRLPEGATGISLTEHLRAQPAWSLEEEDRILVSPSGPLALPRLADPEPWLASVPGPPPGSLEDGLLLCRVQSRLPTRWLHARARLGEVELRARTGSYAPEGRLWLSLPVLPAGSNSTLEIEATDLSSRTQADPFFLLAAGVPIPHNRSTMTSMGRLVLALRGPRPWRGAAEGVEVECAAWTRAEVERALEPTWEVIQAGLEAMCRGRLELGWPRAQEDGLREQIASAAGAVGWADPRLQAALAQVDRVRRGFERVNGAPLP